MEIVVHRSSLHGLLGAAHLGPTLAVTALAGLLAVASDLDPVYAVTVTSAVLAGQLTIGWGNDLVDVARDRTVGRTDKPLATGAVSVRAVSTALAVAGVAAVVLSLAAGWRSAAVHLPLGVAMGQAYNLGLKRTWWSWLPYASAFGTLPSVVSLAGTSPEWAPWWATAAGATLGVGAHLLNTLPDLADDARTGVQGLPHRIGETASRLSAAVLLATASLLAVLGPHGTAPATAWLALVVVALLTVVAATGRGRLPFQAAVGVALLDVVLLVAAR